MTADQYDPFGSFINSDDFDVPDDFDVDAAQNENIRSATQEYLDKAREQDKEFAKFLSSLEERISALDDDPASQFLGARTTALITAMVMNTAAAQADKTETDDDESDNSDRIRFANLLLATLIAIAPDYIQYLEALIFWSGFIAGGEGDWPSRFPTSFDPDELKRIADEEITDDDDDEPINFTD